jgi:5-methylcytosine-specific restriction protein A
MHRYERSPAARQACLSHYGYDCFVCNANLKREYPGLLTELIHVHHEEPLAGNPGPRNVDPISELKPLCPNCHAVVHSRTPPFSVAELRQMREGAN